MKKTGILNVQPAEYITGLGHKERFLTGDVGMPVPKGVPVVNSTLCSGIPTFQQVMDVVLNETVVEDHTSVAEAEKKNPAIVTCAYDKLLRVPEQTILYDELRRQVEDIKFAVCTSEFTPYSNLILQTGMALPG